jgi:hypothetical protein
MWGQYLDGRDSLNAEDWSFADSGWDFEEEEVEGPLSFWQAQPSSAMESAAPVQLSSLVRRSAENESRRQPNVSRRSPAGLPSCRGSFVTSTWPVWVFPAGRSVEKALIDIIGDVPRQSELNSLRELLLLPEAQRSEKRSKVANMAAFEEQRGTILPKLKQEEFAYAVWLIVFNLRSNLYEKAKMLEHLYDRVGRRS